MTKHNDQERALKRCAACGEERPVSEMKTCMHNQMHRYVCDSKCMHDFYNPPKQASAQLPAGRAVPEENDCVIGGYAFLAIRGKDELHVTVDPTERLANARADHWREKGFVCGVKPIKIPVSMLAAATHPVSGEQEPVLSFPKWTDWNMRSAMRKASPDIPGDRLDHLLAIALEAHRAHAQGSDT